jgi:hypothetical protein
MTNELASFKAEFNKLAEIPAERLPIPLAYADPAFNACIAEATSSPELLANFDRLYGCRLSSIGKQSPINRMIDQATGFQNDQLKKFVEFVHQSIYLTMPDKAVHAFRLAALTQGAQHEA